MRHCRSCASRHRLLPGDAARTASRACAASSPSRAAKGESASRRWPPTWRSRLPRWARVLASWTPTSTAPASRSCWVSGRRRAAERANACGPSSAPGPGGAGISMGMFVGDGTPIIWRGPMLTKLIVEFLRNCDWGELDVLVMDLPPGTGDVQLTLTQQVPITGGVIVTTPQDVALADVRRGLEMFRQMHAPVLGVIENMSYHLCPGCGARAELFGHGGGAAMARQLGVPFLGGGPLAREGWEAGDAGLPIVAAAPSSPQSRAFHEIAERVLVRLQDAQRRVAPAELSPSS